MFNLFIYYLVITSTLCYTSGVRRPNIVLIIADDLGWNDVGFHGSNEIPTPNIDALAYSGIVLQNYYVAPLCSPSRSALVTGKYPIHTGMQHGVVMGAEPWGLPLSEKLLPQYLKDLGYSTHLVGKWHLGHFKKEYLPLNRGFDSHVGFWTGRIDMYDHTSMELGTWGLDFRRGMAVADDMLNKYATDIFTDEAAKVIASHNTSLPLFLMLAHSAVHSGNPPETIRAPDELIDQFKHIQNFQRRKFAAVMSKLDESVGKVVAALERKGMLDNTIIMFTTDNGGPAAGFNANAASNFPLRGVKNTLWEGGVRGAGFLWSPLIESRSRIAHQRLHIVDWLPTLYSAAGGDGRVFQGIDGIDQWAALSKDIKSCRKTLVHNIDITTKTAAVTLDQWKIVTGATYDGIWDNWYGPSGREGLYDINKVKNGLAGRIMTNHNFMPNDTLISLLRKNAVVNCGNVPQVKCKPLIAPCLFDIEQDPCEYNNLAQKEPQVLQMMLNYLSQMNSTVVPPNNKPVDLRADPKYWGRVFTNFGDYEYNYTSSRQC